MLLIEPLWNVDVEGSQQPAVIRPDVVLFDDDRRVMIVECKSGTVQQAQLDNYLRLTLEKLQQQTPFSPVSEFQIVYVGIEDHEASCLMSLQGSPLPLISFSAEHARLVREKLCKASTHSLFAKGVPLTGCRIPTRFLPLDNDSTVTEAMQAVAAELLRFAILERQMFHESDLLEEIFGETFGSLHPTFRSEMINLTRKALHQLEKKKALGDVLSFHAGVWALAPDFGSGGMTLRTAARRVQEFIDDLGDAMTLL